MKHIRPWLRNGLFLLVLAVASLASGCVYLRLLNFKNQLADFEKHFSTDLSDGFRINCKDPVLLGDDLRWLGADPEIIRPEVSGEQWGIRWLKELGTQSVVESGTYDIELNADFDGRKLSSIHIPERYFAFVPKQLFLGALQSAGHAKVDRQRREASVNASAEGPETTRPTPVDLGSIEKMLGVPTERTVEAKLLRYRYVFRSQTPSGPGKSVVITFVFDAESGSLRRLIGKLPKGTLNFEFSKPSATKH